MADREERARNEFQETSSLLPLHLRQQKLPANGAGGGYVKTSWTGVNLYYCTCKLSQRSVVERG